jgi:hypothetical protein
MNCWADVMSSLLLHEYLTELLIVWLARSEF